MSRSVVLLVEDDHEMRGVLKTALQDRGYEVVAAASGTQALNTFREAPPHLMILDLGLPDIDGVDVAARVRKRYELPIIVLSARGDEEQQIKALDAGANDFVTKPFREGELMARVRAALRNGPKARELGELVVGDVRMDTMARRVFVGEKEVTLTPTELKLLHLLLCEGGRVVTHRELLCQVWGAHAAEEVQYLRVFMRQLRAKIEEDASRPRRLVTVLGIGYRLAHC
jgi:two-component system KDP operon response regulator KdpE